MRKCKLYYVGEKMVTLNILINNTCNLMCPHCYVDSTRDAARGGGSGGSGGGSGGSGGMMKLSDLEMVMDSLKGEGINFVHILGGEPFLHPHLEDLCAIISEHGIPINIATNGTLVGDSIPWLKKEGISLSVNLLGGDFVKELFGYLPPFKKIVENVARLVENSIDTNGIICPFPVNQDPVANAHFYFDYMVKLRGLTGVSDFFLIYLSKLGRVKEVWDSIDHSMYHPDNWLTFLKTIKGRLEEEGRPFDVYAEPAFESEDLAMNAPPESMQCDLVIKKNFVIDYDLFMYPCVLMRTTGDGKYKVKYLGDIGKVMSQFDDLQDDYVADNAQGCRRCSERAYCCPCAPYIQNEMNDYRCPTKDNKGTLMGCPLITVKL
ncbi:MAG: radical SAM protein [Promethearchaeota archaeon]